VRFNKKQVGIISAITAGICLIGVIAAVTNRPHTDVTAAVSMDAVETEPASGLVIEDVRDYTFDRSTSKVLFIKGEDEEHDITSFVEYIENGSLCLNPDGIRFVFGLGERDITEEEKSMFAEALKENQQIDMGGDYLSFRNKEHTLIFQTGGKMYLFDERVRMLDAPCIKLDNGTVSIPIMDLIFAFGYQSYGVNVDGNDIVFSLIEK